MYVHKKKCHNNEIITKNNNYKHNEASSPLTNIVQKILTNDSVDATLVDELSLKIDRQSSKIIACNSVTNDMVLPSSPATCPQMVLQTFPSDDFEINSLFRQEFSNLEVVEPVENIESTILNDKKNKKSVKKIKNSFNNEGCARTFLTYSIYTEQKKQLKIDEENIISLKTIACETDTILSQETIVESTENIVLQEGISDSEELTMPTKTMMTTTTDVTYACSVTDGLSLTEPPSEMIINADLLQDDQQHIYLNNLVLQVNITIKMLSRKIIFLSCIICLNYNFIIYSIRLEK